LNKGRNSVNQQQTSKFTHANAHRYSSRTSDNQSQNDSDTFNKKFSMQKYSDVFGKKPYINEENTNEINNKNINIQTPLRSQKDKKGVNKNGY